MLKINLGRMLNSLNQLNRQTCRALLSMMDKMEVRLERFGDAAEPLPDV